MKRFVLGTGISAESSISPFNPAFASSFSSFSLESLQFQPKSFVCNVSR
ncbi:MAG: hypothetical protein ACFE9N_12605 [Promethearchaeota archaeon]